MNHSMIAAYPQADRDLSIRLERAEAMSNREFVEARSRVSPGSGAMWMEVAGTFALFDFKGSPLTQTFGLGISTPATPSDMEILESFFRSRDADTYHEVSPLADPSTMSMLNARGYRPIECTNVLYRPTSGEVDPGTTTRVQARPIHAEEEGAWSVTSASGWSEYPELAEFMNTAAAVMMRQRNAILFIAENERVPVATGALNVHDGVALLAGASTIPGARNQGAQLALLRERLDYACRQGCDLAMMCARPGSTSQRNAERHGFRVAYTRIKWHLGPRISSYTL